MMAMTAPAAIRRVLEGWSGAVVVVIRDVVAVVV